MTEITRDSLQRRYSDFVDAELLRRLHSGVLTELAQDVATAEAQARGLSLEKPEAAGGPAVIDDIDFAPDEFERNPYQAPRVVAQASVANEHVSTRTGIWDVLWYIYVGVLSLAIITVTVLQANPFDVPALVKTTTTGFCLAGIIGWRRRRAWLHPMLWITSAAISLAWLTVQLRHAWTVVDSAGGSDLVPMFLIGTAISTALYLPLYWGLLRYALFSPSIWRKRTPQVAGEL